LDKVFTETELEKHPKKDTMSVKSFGESQKQSENKKHLYDIKEVKELLEKLRQYFKTRRVLIEPHFSDFDKHKSGKVSPTNFRRGLNKIFEFTIKEYELLESLYRDQNGDISYKKFVEDIEPLENRNNKQIQTNKEQQVFSYQEENEEDIEQVLKEVTSQVKKNSIRLKDFFIDYDKLRHGLCTVQKFRTGLAMTNIILTDSQRKLLEKYFKSKDEDVEMINYLNFCSYIDSSFVETELLTKPTKELKEFVPLPRFPLTGSLSLETIKQYEKAMRKMCYLTTTQNIILKPYFQDYEVIRRERVTKTQFASVLDKLKLKLEKEEVDALIQKYLDVQGDVDYVSFCRDVENQNGTRQSFTS
jgi:Ca2+-binding EF-hand superfamily protein